MKTAVFLSVRDKATRLPGKVWTEFGGRPAIEQLILRLKRASDPDEIVLCTSAHPDDERLLATAERMGVVPFAGSEDDKLERYLAAADRHGVEFAAVVDGDDIFCEPRYIDTVIREGRERGGDYVLVRDLPVGATAFGIRVEALRAVVALKDERDTEVWGGYFTRGGLDCRALEPDPEDRRPDLRFTLDYPEDRDLFRMCWRALAPPDGGPALRDAIRYCDREPRAVGLMRAAQSRYEENLKRAAPVRLRSSG